VTQSSQIAGMLGPALSMLTESERTAFILRHYEESSIEEIAQILGVQTGAAKQTVYRAVQKLRTALEPAWGFRPSELNPTGFRPTGFKPTGFKR
jgi:RNA polymerase sigma-70 factor (ECF subfamily)